jgi:hypothetical protein
MRFNGGNKGEGQGWEKGGRLRVVKRGTGRSGKKGKINGGKKGRRLRVKKVGGLRGEKDKG